MESITNQPWYILLRDFSLPLITLAGVIVGGKGIASWKKPLKGGNKRFEVSYSLNYSLLKLRDAIKYVRNPAVWPSEMQAAQKYASQKHPDKTETEIQKDIQSYVYEMRWEKITSAQSETESHLLATEVIWGPKIRELIRPLNVKITELLINLKQKFEPEMRTKSILDIHKVVYDQGDGYNNDEFSKEVEKIIKSITSYIEGQLEK